MATINCVWGEKGIESLDVDCFIIVDVLSFSTCVDVVTSQGGKVVPYIADPNNPHADSRHYADSLGCQLAWIRPAADELPFSPSGLQGLPTGTKLVLPSPNGSLLSMKVGNVPTFAGCLRNANAVGARANAYERIGVVAAGERWRDKSLRPALEDWLGAGAIIHALEGDKMPEAKASESAFLALRDTLPDVLTSIPSGIELQQKERSADLQLSAKLNVSTTIPKLIDGAYQIMDVQ